MPGGFIVELEPRQRNALIIGTLAGAVLGAGIGWLLVQTAPEDSDEERKPIRPGEILKIVGASAVLLRQLDDLRYRL
jgi:gas vesicle protein